VSNLKAIRKAAGLSQIELAKRASVSRFRIYLAEAGSIVLRPEELAAISEAVRPEMAKAARLASEFETLASATV
jgi:transcriptional regulator with XRE-family HTH domain